jgi:3'-phosphoadenosine 5'-phosphosulfate sulfotransferase (PAPS reductase)/FAD synthetase
LSSTKYTNEDLKEMQSWPLERKIQVSQTRILEFGLRYEGLVYVSFSGGKDSTVLLDLVRRVFPDTPAVFIDTGLEYPEVRQFALAQPGVVVVKPELTFRQVIEKYGYPLISKSVSHFINIVQIHGWGCGSAKYLKGEGKREKGPSMFNCQKWAFLVDSGIRTSDMCCNIMKKKPAHKYEKETGRKPFVGTMACESNVRKTVWLSHGCNIFDGNKIKSAPMSFWTEQDVLEYLRRFKLPYAPVYGEIVEDGGGHLRTTGCDRTGCVFCGFGCHIENEPNRFQRLKESHPALYRFCMKPWDQGGLGLKDVFDYINKSVADTGGKHITIKYE